MEFQKKMLLRFTDLLRLEYVENLRACSLGSTEQYIVLDLYSTRTHGIILLFLLHILG